MPFATRIRLVLAVVGILAASPALACGDSEAGTPCDEGGTGAEMGARWMLTRVVAALGRDKPGALAQFAAGTNGFRTADTYVFCVGPDGMMTAHPNAILNGQNVRDLHDRTGNYFIRTMLETARSGEVQVIRYVFPKPGSTVEEPKITFYTRADDQMCGVGVYEADAAAPKADTPEARIAHLRRRLDGAIPASARGDWNAFLEALNAQAGAREAALTKAREGLRAADAALAPGGQALAAD